MQFEAIHNKDHSVVKTFKAAQVAFLIYLNERFSFAKISYFAQMQALTLFLSNFFLLQIFIRVILQFLNRFPGHTLNFVTFANYFSKMAYFALQIE